ncbi:MAG: D-alanyl-D-alanine carboxypeptidase family protein [Mangrovicoccus sp.]
MVWLMICGHSSAAAFETQAKSAFVLDLSTGTVLLEKNADTPMPPASMSKLMTLYMLFEAVRDNPNVSLDTRFGVSTKAREMTGSTMFLNERDRPTVEELIRGIIVQSGNDATVAVAEGLAGTEDAFARLMNERARDLGMTNSTFANASGWPNPIHRMSMRDLGILSQQLIKEFPEYYGYFAETEFDFDGRAPRNRFNRNPLLRLDIGVDGLKTGHTEEAGYGMVGSAAQGDRRIIFVISGLDSASARADEGERIVNWAFRQFLEKQIATKGQRLAEAPVWMGDVQSVGLVAAQDMTVLIPVLYQDDVTAKVEFRGPIEAPIIEDRPIAELVVTRRDLPDARLPLYAERPVNRGGFVPHIRSASLVLARKFISQIQDFF